MKPRTCFTGVRLVIFLFFYNRLSKETEFGHLHIDLLSCFFYDLFASRDHKTLVPLQNNNFIKMCPAPLPTFLDPSWNPSVIDSYRHLDLTMK